MAKLEVEAAGELFVKSRKCGDLIALARRLAAVASLNQVSARGPARICTAIAETKISEVGTACAAPPRRLHFDTLLTSCGSARRTMTRPGSLVYYHIKQSSIKSFVPYAQ